MFSHVGVIFSLSSHILEVHNSIEENFIKPYFQKTFSIFSQDGRVFTSLFWKIKNPKQTNKKLFSESTLYLT